MTAPATSNPLRPKALDYLRSGRLNIWLATSPGPDYPASLVLARIKPAPGDQSGYSVAVDVQLIDGRWDCDEHPGENWCSHRLAAQMDTGHAHLGGGWKA